MGWNARQDWLRSQLSAPPPLTTVYYLPSMVMNTMLMCEVNHVQIKNSVTESCAKNETMPWLSGTDNSASCSSPYTLSVSSMMEKNATSVHCAKYVQMAVNKRTLLMKDEMTKYCVTESYATNTMLLTMCEVNQVQVVNSVTTMLLMMQEVDQVQVEISVTVHYAMNKMGVCLSGTSKRVSC